MEMNRKRTLACLATLVGLACSVLSLPARADLSGVSPTGFTVTYREEVKAEPAQAWQAIAQLPRWWNGSHSYSGQASNMSLELAAGGCWCERWGDGNQVMHGQVAALMPGRMLRLNAALGPLQDLAVNGTLTLVTSASEGKTFLRLTYRVSGDSSAALDKLAPPVERVLAEQYKRLKALIETGKPD
jgi:uncharacterized protein YndB with AHSA1/START domain